MTPQRRFTIAVTVTVLVVAYLVVPWVAAVIDGLGTYSPSGYEPRDFSRVERSKSVTDPASWTSDTAINAGLFLLLAVVWYVAAGSRRR